MHLIARKLFTKILINLKLEPRLTTKETIVILELALKAKVPLITCTTTDPINAPDIISHLAGEVVAHYDELDLDEFKDARGNVNDERDANIIVVKPTATINQGYEEIYEFCVNNHFCFVLLNSEYESPVFTNVGAIPTPTHLIANQFKLVMDEDDEVINDYVATVKGLDIKTVTEIIKMTLIRDEVITIDGIIKTRKAAVMDIEGLRQLSTDLKFYEPLDAIVNWVDVNASYIKRDDIDARLRPRGLMFTGLTGCGKTQGAKYIANQLGLPLYLLNLSNLLTRWYGESEGKLNVALQRIDDESPCVVLLDEIEKIFKGTDEGTTGRMLAQLLWWLQERTSSAIVVMTCNDLEALPSELYREGRLDTTIEFVGVQSTDAAARFVRHLIGTYHVENKPSAIVIEELVNVAFEETPHGDLGVTYAYLTAETERVIKELNPL
ncbi:hypothetical protein [Vibrio phage vB_VhaS-a]|nr:hypothetical protein [Vibrio phage vB_VhaS-a]